MGYSIRSDRYRYTVWVEWKNKVTNADKVFAEELYDYQDDPEETANVASEPGYADALQEMKNYWNQYKAQHIRK